MSKFWVYIHIVPNGKRYVGCTKVDKPEQRWQYGHGYKFQFFGKAILKYGWDSITHEVFEVESEEEMYYLEKYLIAYYETDNLNKGYNRSTGGEKSSKGVKRTEETKRKLSQSLKGKKKPHSEEWSKKVSESLKGHPGFFKGRKHSEETRRKMSEKQKGLSKPYKGKPKALFTYRFPDGHLERMTATKACQAYVKKGIVIIKVC